MKIMFNKNNKHEMLLIGESENDTEVLQALFDNHVCWGFHTFWRSNPENKGTELPLYKMLVQKFGALTCYGHFSSPEGFVPSYEKKDESTGKIYERKPEPKVDSDSLFNDLLDDEGEN